MSARLVLADDDEAVTSTLAPPLERSGYKVVVARDGLEAVRLAREQQPDLLILDIRMPRLDGRAVCRQLRESRDWTPVIMLTEVGLASERAMYSKLAVDCPCWMSLSRSTPGTSSARMWTFQLPD